MMKDFKAPESFTLFHKNVFLTIKLSALGNTVTLAIALLALNA